MLIPDSKSSIFKIFLYFCWTASIFYAKDRIITTIYDAYIKKEYTMVKRIRIEEYLAGSELLPIIDVRTPSEFHDGHIPGAVNVPLFSDEERAKVGTAYKKISPEKAYEIGYKFVDPKLKSFIDDSKQIAKDGSVVVYCWRGGMRSKAFADHIEANGLENVKVIEGGYKAFRIHALESFTKPDKLYILGGYTGSGKTRILKRMRELGDQIIDLEGIANHKGSAFGAIGQEEQPQNEHFTNLLFWAWRDMDMSRPIWLEDESIHIGKVFIPEVLFSRMRDAHLYFLNISKEERGKLLVEDYPHADKQLLEMAIHRITKRLGGLRATEAIEALENDDFYTCAIISLDYYDKFYLKGLNKRDAASVTIIESDSCDTETNVNLVRSLPDEL